MYIKTGIYTGNGTSGTTTNAIAGIGFQPRFVMVRRYNSSELPIARSESMSANNSKPMTSSSAIQTTTGIISLDSDGFTLKGQDTTTNQNGSTYFYLAVGGEGTDFAYGSYTGNASDNRDITIGGSFSSTPDLVFVMGENADRAVWKSSDMVGDLSGAFNQTLTTNTIQAFGAGTFQVGTNAQTNSNTVLYHYVAFKNQSSFFKVFTYTGNGSDNRNITGLGFLPTCSYVQASGVSGVIRNSAAHSGDSSTNFDNTSGNAANKIQDHISDGIQVGTDASVNTNTTVYYAFAFTDAAIPASGTGSPNLSQLTVAGSATEATPNIASGADTLPKLTASATSGVGMISSGTPTLPKIVSAGSAISGPYATGSPSLTKMSMVGSASYAISSNPREFDADTQTFEWIHPIAESIYNQIFASSPTILEWVHPQASSPKYRSITILTLPQYGIFIHDWKYPNKRIRDITHLASNIDRNYSRMDVGNTSLTLPKLAQDDHAVHQGNILVIQTRDQPAWVGPIFTLSDTLGQGTVEVHALDMGSMLARRVTDPKEHYTTAVGSGFIIRSLINKMNAKGATGITIGQIDPGPTIYDLEIGGQSLLDALGEIHDRTDWEWWIENEVTSHSIKSRFYWGRRQGLDLSRTAHLWYGHHFSEGTLTHDLSEGKQVSIVIGGFGSKMWTRPFSSASSIASPKVSMQSILNQLAPELNVRSNNQLPAALRDERQRKDVLTENPTEIQRGAQRDAIRRMYAETTINFTVTNFDRNSLRVGNFVTIHAPLGHHGELDGAVRLVEVQPDDELEDTLCTAEVRL